MAEKRKKPKFMRRDWNRKIRFKRQKFKWRAAKGRHSKIREKRKNRPRMPTIGYGNPREIRGMIKGFKPVYVSNEKDLAKIGKNEIGILSSTVGNRKRIEIAEKSKGIRFMNFNPEKFLQEMKMKEVKKAETKTETKKPEKIDKKQLKNEIKGEEKK